jgi:GGDEF domain-containing protein
VSVERPHWRPAEVADVRLDPLLHATDALAKRWLIALLQERPLERAPEIPLDRFAREAPELCTTVLRALESDAELHRLQASVAPGRLAELVGAGFLPEVVVAVEALRTVLWRALTEALPNLGAGAAGRLADRLAHACSLIVASTLAPEIAPPEPQERAALESPQQPQPAPPSVETPQQPSAGQPERTAPEPSAQREHAPAEVVAEEHDRAPRIEMQDARERGEEPALEDPWAFDTSATPADAPPPEDVASEIERHSGDGERFVVLLIEVVDFERLREAAEPADLDDLLAAVQRALSEALGPAERLAAEGAARWWLVAQGARAAEGRSLAELLARSVGAAVTHHHVPLRITIGVAASPEDGADAAELAERAEEELFAARAAGLSVLPDRAATF